MTTPSGTPEDAPFDAGLQPERTLLAWRRTALSFAVAGLVAERLVAGTLGPVLAIMLGVAVVACAAGAYVLASRRYRRAHERLVAAAALPTGGRAVTALAAAAALIAVAGAVFVVGAVALR